MSENIYSILTVLLGGGIITAIIAAIKFRPERDSVIVTSAQNATNILKQLNTNLQAELQRQRSVAEERDVTIIELEETIDQLEQQIDQLESTIQQLRTTLGKLPPKP